jgi:hypothetical protein
MRVRYQWNYLHEDRPNARSPWLSHCPPRLRRLLVVPLMPKLSWTKSQELGAVSPGGHGKHWGLQVFGDNPISVYVVTFKPTGAGDP